MGTAEGSGAKGGMSGVGKTWRAVRVKGFRENPASLLESYWCVFLCKACALIGRLRNSKTAARRPIAGRCSGGLVHAPVLYS